MSEETIEALVQQLADGYALEALAGADAIVARDVRIAEAHELRALALTVLGRIDEADRAFEQAAAIEPDEYFRPFRLTKDAFDRFVERILLHLPAEFRAFLENVEIGVDDAPSLEMIREGLEFDLLGVYIGSTADSDEWGFPDRVVLYQRNLENISPDEETLLKEIRDTLLHEVGHHFGMDEETLRELEDGG